MKDIEATKWREIRVKGKAHYILTHGILQFGLPFSAVFNGTKFIQPQISWVKLAIVVLGGALAGGIVFGLLMWSIKEKSFKEFEDKNK
jgi:hypothetical protein